MNDNQTNNIRVLLADDHILFRSGLKKIIDMENNLEVCGEAQNGEEVLEKVKLLKPDVVLMDINMPYINGVEATREVKESYPDVKIIALTIHDDEEYLFEIVKEGASGYLLKDVDTPTLARAIEEVANGNCFIHPNVTHKLLGGFNRLAKNSPGLIKGNNLSEEDCDLTIREREILGLLAKGYSNNDLSEELGISEKTVKNHVSSILRKLDVSDRTQAVVTAFKNGLVEL
ncbi:response regulator [Natranaerofaba carboxydovora]|uniref:response regulator n=1 Tax=Natranaerofaba carboxydovora TaxID=2742683 RepID=UPI001F1405E2|nr:response regulator transcription factor [Natranaerofaba carboxydovora]UMZ75040.1 Transcriptional regulatory protein DegU [Natranaerofaba carboxydovora]